MICYDFTKTMYGMVWYTAWPNGGLRGSVSVENTTHQKHGFKTGGIFTEQPVDF